MTLPVDWSERGRELSATLDGCHAVVILGSDVSATAEVALGVARVQAVTAAACATAFCNANMSIN